MAKRLLIFAAASVVAAAALIYGLNALDASKAVAWVAVVLFSGIGGGIGAALFTPRKAVE